MKHTTPMATPLLSRYYYHSSPSIGSWSPLCSDKWNAVRLWDNYSAIDQLPHYSGPEHSRPAASGSPELDLQVQSNQLPKSRSDPLLMDLARCGCKVTRTHNTRLFPKASQKTPDTITRLTCGVEQRSQPFLASQYSSVMPVSTY